MSTNHAYIDANTRNSWSLYNETTGIIEPARVDPVTGALLIYAVGNISATPSSFNRAGIDGNGRDTLAGLDETTNSIEAFRCDSSGNLLVAPQ
jgi:hypothetical protein